MFDDIMRLRLERDLGHEPDEARVSVRAGDLRALLARVPRDETPYEQQRFGANINAFLKGRARREGRRG